MSNGQLNIISLEDDIPTLDINLHVLETFQPDKTIKITLFEYEVTSKKKLEFMYKYVVVVLKRINDIISCDVRQKKFKDLKTATRFYEQTIREETNKVYDKKLCRKRM